MFSLKDLIKRFLSNSATYGAFSFIRQFGAFFIIPIYWHYLTPTDYGILALTSLITNIFTPIIILGLQEGVERFYYIWTHENRKLQTGRVWCLGIITGLSITLLIEAGGRYIIPRVFEDMSYVPYFQMVTWTMFFNSFTMIPFRILRVTEKIKFYGVCSLFQFIINSTLVIMFLSIMDMGVSSVFLGGLINSIFWALFWIVWIWNKIKISVNFKYIKSEIHYSLPSLPINIINRTGLYFDRYLLGQHLSLANLGLYNVGNSFGNYYNQVNSAFKTAWYPMLFKMHSDDKKDLKDVLPVVSLFYYYMLLIFALSAALFSREIICFFGSEKFIKAYPYVPYFVLIYLIMNFSSAFGRGIDLVKKTYFDLISSISGAVVSVVLLCILVPRYGTYGAISALLASTSIRTVVTVTIAHSLYKRVFPFQKIVALSAVALFSFYNSYGFEHQSIFYCLVYKIFYVLLFIIWGGIIIFGFSSVIKQTKRIVNKVHTKAF
ncbi:oligosaccharide flippase family protein [uncultured Desulfobacter sp.]|uniref:lipopolysaccharide biosynthesis protein n=1 Tax=uncultured Desulfobacter sp. TaxID=240139 RepID=UPI002AA83D93|nr:oligosaccharide flippase family protein [uncultured Desulfobacter sp.]